MSRRYDQLDRHELDQMQEQAERTFEWGRPDAKFVEKYGMSGQERPLNSDGDRIFVGCIRVPGEVLADRRSSFVKEDIYLRTSRAGQETARSSMSIESHHDLEGTEYHRAWLHDIIIAPSARDQGYEDIVLREVELQAQRYRASEVFYVPESTAIERRFLEHGYQPDRNEYGSVLRKPLVPSAADQPMLNLPFRDHARHASPDWRAEPADQQPDADET